MRRLIHASFVFLLPLIVAWFGLSVLSAAFLVVAALLWRWLVAISALFAPEKQPGLILETIPASHFAEKARWCLDRLGVDYVERPCAGILGAIFTGRTVPRLHFQSGRVRSSIGNSPEILRYLWGANCGQAGDAAKFLEPNAERLVLEKAIDRYGVDLQVWVYSHVLSDKEVTLRLWGADDPQIPRWQRLLLRPLYPLNAAFIRKTFSISDEHYAKAVQHIDERLGDIDTRLADGRGSILGGDEINFVDITFAAISGLWLQPENYGGGRADACKVARNKLPASMRADIERWSEDHPRATAFIQRMYAAERIS